MADRNRPLRGRYIPYENSIATSPFGNRAAILNAPPGHAGVDIGAPYGTPVHAATDGTIYYTGSASKYGNVVVVQSLGPNGEIYDTRYGHIDNIPSFKLDQEIKRGDIIGYVAPVGTSTGPHVHYEVRVFDKGTPIGVNHAVNGQGLYSEPVEKSFTWGRAVDPETFDYFGNPVFNAIPLPRPRPDILEPSAVSSDENAGTPANTVDDDHWLASVLNPKSLTPDVPRLDTWPQPPYPPGAFYPQTPNGIVDYRFYHGASASPGRGEELSPAPPSPPPLNDQPASGGPFNPYRLQPFPQQLLPPSTSGSATRASMPGAPNAETPLARLLRLTASEPATDPVTASDPSATPAADRAPFHFTDPLAALAAIVRLSAMRDGSG